MTDTRFNPDEMHIVCGTDDNYVPHLAALLSSIADNKGRETIHVHGILDGVQPANLALIEGMRLDLVLHWYQVADHDALDLPDESALRMPSVLHISRATYLRLISDKLLPEDLSRVLYLDIDMIVTDSLLPIWQIELGDNACAAVTNPGTDLEEFAQRFGLEGKSDYFNAGMILFDLDVVRRENLFQTALDALQADPEKFAFADQDALNIVYWGRWHALDPSYNFQRKFLMTMFPFESRFAASDTAPKIIHYTQALKPWKPDEWHPYRWLYRKHLKRTPFSEKILKGAQIGPLNLLRSWVSYRKFVATSGLAKCAVHH